MLEPLAPRARPRRSGVMRWAAVALAAAALAHPGVSFAAQFELAGSGQFKPPTAEQLARLPTDLPFTRSDLASGQWSFRVRYDDAAPDTDPDPLIGRYPGAVRAFRLVVGHTAVDLPVDQASLLVSDGGAGFANRESVRLQVLAALPAGLLRVSWVQINQPAAASDLRGTAGALASDALPPAAAMAALPVANAADRYLELRLDAPPTGSTPLLYLSSSQPQVTVSPTTAP